MNTNKVWAQSLAVVGVLVSALQMVAPVLPHPWDALTFAVIGVFAFYNIGQSHKPAALGAAGYRKVV